MPRHIGQTTQLENFCFWTFDTLSPITKSAALARVALFRKISENLLCGFCYFLATAVGEVGHGRCHEDGGEGAYDYT